MSDVDFDEAWRAFDPLEPVPPGDGWYEDLWPYRGVGDVSESIARAIARGGARPYRALLLGHAGCGKSTELNRLKTLLADRGYEGVIVPTDEALDGDDLEIGDVLLLIVEKTLEVLSRRQTDLHALPGPTVKARRESLEVWLETLDTTETVSSTKGGRLDIGGAFNRLFTLRGEARVSREKRVEIRKRIRQRQRSFVDLAAGLLDDARAGLQLDEAAPRKGLVILVDGLEKAAGLDDGRPRAAAILLDHSELWALLGVPLVCAAPLALLAESTRIQNHFDEHPLIPAIPVSGRPDRRIDGLPGYVIDARKGLRELVAKRAPIDRMFEPDTFDTLLELSGGSIRDLFRLLRNAIDAREELKRAKIDADAVALAWKRHALQVVSVKRARDDDRIRRLLADAETFDFDEDGISLLKREIVLPYHNGGRWFGVHPAIGARYKLDAA